MEKKLVLEKVSKSPSSVFLKSDVLQLIDSIDNNPIKIYQMETKQQDPAEKLVSLYEYLGHAAGAELGKKVAKAATKAYETMDVRKVDTKKYKGNIMLYREVFLDEYFQTQQR